MANTERRKLDKQGRQFMPMNVDGGLDEHRFINTKKLIYIGILTVGLLAYISNGRTVGYTWTGWLFTGLVIFLIYQWVIRKFIFEEDYYYKIRKANKQLVNTTPDVAWSISSIRKTEYGDILIYSDMKIGCIVKLDKDTIIGKAEGSAEKHFDAWSEFYKELNLRDLKRVQLNIMEPAGKDSRITEVAETASSSNNKNLRYLLETEIGYIKSISRVTLNESDYILIYTDRASRIDSLLADVTECCYKLLEGAYRSAVILDDREIYQLPRGLHNVGIFDGIAAQMNVYKNSGFKIEDAFELIGYGHTELGSPGIKYSKLSKKDINVISKLSSLVNNGYIKYGEWTIKDALSGKLNINKFDNLSTPNITNNEEVSSKRKVKKHIVSKKTKKNTRKPETKVTDDFDLTDDFFSAETENEEELNFKFDSSDTVEHIDDEDLFED